MTAAIIISASVIILSAIYYLRKALTSAIKSIFESSREIYESEAEKLLLSNIKIPVSIIISPVERYETLKKIIESALTINHPMFQIIVMLKKGCTYTNNLISDFDLVRLDAVYRMILKSARAEQSYRSTTDKRLTVIVADRNRCITVSVYLSLLGRIHTRERTPSSARTTCNRK